MKIINKTTLSLGLTWAAFVGVNFFSPVHSSMIIFSSLAIASFLISIALLRSAYIKNIEQLKEQMDKIDTSASSLDHVSVRSDDEITSIETHINDYLCTIQDLHESYEKKMIASVQAFEIEKQQLQQAIAAAIKPADSTPQLDPDTEYLKRIAKHDNLTALPNRVFFNEILNKAINHAKRRSKILALLLINIDSFKKISASLSANDSELIVKEIGKRFTNVLRTEDVLAKLDGDQFIVLLNDIVKPKFASSVAEKILQVCSHPMKIDTHEFALSANIGICVFPNDGDSLEHLLKNAENALFKATHSGPNVYQFHTHELDVEAREYIQMEAALRQAIHNNELTLYYQPKFSIKRGEIVGLEALMRWEHPELGIINPSKFIPLADETGLIMHIGEWAIREACRTSKYWQDEGYEHLTVSLNLSSRQFHHPEIAKIIANAVKSTGLNPKYLEFEITETTVMQNIELATKILNGIKATGTQLSLDHFGTGYTSISALKQFPISRIKIDQTFIKSIPTIPNDMAITSAVIALAHNLGFEVVAEGVETAEQVQFLSQQNCDMVQGYFLGHPQSADRIVLQFKKLHDEVLQ